MILAAGAAHAEAMAVIHAAAFPAAPWSAASFAVLLAQPGVTALIDERGGVVLLRAAADEAEILTIGVVARHQGIGRALLGAALELARSLGVAKLFLEVAAGNAAARGLYATAGFTEAGRRPNYYPDGGDALILSLAL